MTRDKARTPESVCHPMVRLNHHCLDPHPPQKRWFVHPLPLNFPWFMSLNEFNSKPLKSNPKWISVLYLLDMSPMVGAYVLFHAHHLDACEQKSLGKHARLSSWCLRYGLMKWSSLLLLKCLGIYLKKNGKSFAKLLFDMLKSYQSHMMIFLEDLIHLCCLFCIELCQICCDPWENSFHTFMIKIHVHTIYPLAMLLWEVSIVPSTHSTK